MSFIDDYNREMANPGMRPATTLGAQAAQDEIRMQAERQQAFDPMPYETAQHDALPAAPDLSGSDATWRDRLVSILARAALVAIILALVVAGPSRVLSLFADMGLWSLYLVGGVSGALGLAWISSVVSARLEPWLPGALQRSLLAHRREIVARGATLAMMLAVLTSGLLGLAIVLLVPASDPALRMAVAGLAVLTVAPAAHAIVLRRDMPLRGALLLGMANLGLWLVLAGSAVALVRLI